MKKSGRAALIYARCHEAISRPLGRPFLSTPKTRGARNKNKTKQKKKRAAR